MKLTKITPILFIAFVTLNSCKKEYKMDKLPQRNPKDLAVKMYQLSNGIHIRNFTLDKFNLRGVKTIKLRSELEGDLCEREILNFDKEGFIVSVERMSCQAKWHNETPQKTLINYEENDSFYIVHFLIESSSSEEFNQKYDYSFDKKSGYMISQYFYERGKITNKHYFTYDENGRLLTESFSRSDGNYSIEDKLIVDLSYKTSEVSSDTFITIVTNKLNKSSSYIVYHDKDYNVYFICDGYGRLLMAEKLRERLGIESEKEDKTAITEECPNGCEKIVVKNKLRKDWEEEEHALIEYY